MSTTTTTTKTVTQSREGRNLLTHSVRHVEKQTTPQRNAALEPMQPINRLPGTEDRRDRVRSQREPIRVTLVKLLKLQLKISNKTRGLHSGAAIERPQIIILTLPPIPKIV